MIKPKPKVFVGMSGGVDSSVSAALLKKAGYEVTGVFIRVWEPEGRPCTWRAERREAMRVAAHLDIPLITLDLAEEYKRGVVDYLVAEYEQGRTPNPDVMCNKRVKFGAFYDWAIAHGADLVATGHYAQLKDNKFLRAKDAGKDQTYFLWNLRAEQLSRLLFPIGGYVKDEVRQLAQKFKLSNAEKPDSQGLCFIGKVDFKDFLRGFIPTKPGEVLDEEGKVIGQHDGANFYTIGERHGFRVQSSTSHNSPLYVVARDIAANTLTVAPRKVESRLSQREVKLEQVNWIAGRAPNSSLLSSPLLARIRHRGELVPCGIKFVAGQTVVVFTKPPEAIAAGQSLVLYRGQECLGGGVILC